MWRIERINGAAIATGDEWNAAKKVMATTDEITVVVAPVVLMKMNYTTKGVAFRGQG